MDLRRGFSRTARVVRCSCFGFVRFQTLQVFHFTGLKGFKLQVTLENLEFSCSETFAWVFGSGSLFVEDSSDLKLFLISPIDSLVIV